MAVITTKQPRGVPYAKAIAVYKGKYIYKHIARTKRGMEIYYTAEKMSGKYKTIKAVKQAITTRVSMSKGRKK